MKKALYPSWNHLNEGWVSDVLHTVTCSIFKALEHYTKEVEEVLPQLRQRGSSMEINSLHPFTIFE